MAEEKMSKLEARDENKLSIDQKDKDMENVKG